jgi:hypothetical protein
MSNIHIPTGLLLEMCSRLIIVNKLLTYFGVQCTAYLYAQSFFIENRGKKVVFHLEIQGQPLGIDTK